jgi:hypothetical protein
LVVSAVAAVLISETLRIPFPAYSAYLLFFVVNEDGVSSIKLGLLAMAGLTVALVAAMGINICFMDAPWFRLPATFLLIAGTVWLSRTLVLAVIGRMMAVIFALYLSLADTIFDPESLTEATLWMWSIVGVTVGVSALVRGGNRHSGREGKRVRRLPNSCTHLSSSITHRVRHDNCRAGRSNRAGIVPQPRSRKPGSLRTCVTVLVHFPVRPCAFRRSDTGGQTSRPRGCRTDDQTRCADHFRSGGAPVWKFSTTVRRRRDKLWLPIQQIESAVHSHSGSDSGQPIRGSRKGWITRVSYSFRKLRQAVDLPADILTQYRIKAQGEQANQQKNNRQNGQGREGIWHGDAKIGDSRLKKDKNPSLRIMPSRLTTTTAAPKAYLAKRRFVDDGSRISESKSRIMEGSKLTLLLIRNIAKLNFAESGEGESGGLESICPASRRAQ